MSFYALSAGPEEGVETCARISTCLTGPADVNVPEKHV